jgi:hypothetical protein
VLIDEHAWKRIGILQIIISAIILLSSIIVIGGVVINGIIIMSVGLLFLTSGIRAVKNNSNKMHNYINLIVCLSIIVPAYFLCRYIVSCELAGLTSR